MVESRSPRQPRPGAGRAVPAYLVSLAGAGSAAALIITGHRVWAGVAALLGGVALSLGAYLAEADQDLRERFAARVADPVFDACILAAIAWAARGGSVATSVLALVGLGLSYLASYERARAQSLRYRANESPAYRAARSAVLAAGLLFGVVLASMWVFVVLTGAAAVVRAVNVATQAGGPIPGHGATPAGGPS